MKVINGKFKNGLRYIIVNTDCENNAHISVNVYAGSRDEDNSNKGISHFLEHMLFKGTKNYPTTKKLTWEIEKYGGDFNAYTSLDHTKYHIDIPNKYINKAVDILYEIINESLLEEKEIKKEIKVILNEKRISEGDESDVCIDKLLKLSIKGINTDILGNYNNIKNINRGELIKYLEEYYTPENMILTLVGNNINKNIINKFNNIKNKNKNIIKKKAKILNNIQTIYKKGILPQANIAIGYQIDIKDNIFKIPHF